MTFQKLKELIAFHHIPEDVHLMSDSGWECDATEMDGVYLNRTKNVLVFTQDTRYNDYEDNKEWENVSRLAV